MSDLKRMLSVFLTVTFVFLMTTVKGEDEMNYDKQIIEVICELDCPALISGISDQIYGSYSVIESSGLHCIRSWDYGEGTIELYEGKKSDYLAVLRNNDRVYCAQYVNGSDTQVRDQTNIISENVYYHRIVSSASGIYVRTEIAFFMDCQSIQRIFSSPVEQEADYFSISDAECILAIPQTKS